MKIGVITDSHLGIDDDLNDDILTLIRNIRSYFDSKNIDNIVHLGDMIHESENTINHIKKISNIFSDFNKYMTPGNHDVIESSVSDFEDFGWTCSGFIDKNENRAIKIVDTSSKSKYDNTGYLPQSEIASIKKAIKNGTNLHLISHYPLEKVYESQVFESIPERAYPINKNELFLECDHRNYSGDINSVLCGHQHPNRTRDFKGQPTGMNIIVFEPILNFSIDSDGVNPTLNNKIDMSNLIVDL